MSSRDIEEISRNMHVHPNTHAHPEGGSSGKLCEQEALFSVTSTTFWWLVLSGSSKDVLGQPQHAPLAQRGLPPSTLILRHPLLLWQ